ncbi:hypothetical protein FIBSPDRAFT_919309 [Athelia psychrophila]|uniref:Arrestin C-terminal-like domain-containing protein n=1 Tax=Athelia psychrophila TaxID=1759441 RepID=A0A166L5R9_9AGAM|nr:hypothetical protein FIBSPDRAFT_919309 [Fibularhizoctonia sp. CBS 109695]
MPMMPVARRQAPQTRPEPMNASPNHSKVKVSLALSDAVYVAGGFVSGKMEMECRAGAGTGPGDTLGIGVMMVELVAIQELTSRDHSASSTFLHRRRLFQGPGLPPSNAVLPIPPSSVSSPSSLPALPIHYHVARRGQTTFFFRIPLPRRAPASIAFGGGLAVVRYEIRATVGVWWKGERRLVVDRKPVEVVESYSVEDQEEGEAAGWTGEKVVVGEGGKVWVQGKIVGGAGGGVVVAGESACVELQVKNHGNKKTSGLQITLSRYLHLPSLSTSSAKPAAKLEIADTIATIPYRGPEYCVPAGGEGVATLVFDVPRVARSVRGGPRHSSSPSSDDEDIRDTEGDQSVDALFEIRCIVSVKVLVGLGAKDVSLDLPVRVLHPLAMPAVEDVPLISPPLSYPGSPQPLMSPHSQQQAWLPHPSQSPPLFSPQQQQQTWLPHPSQTPVPGPYQYFSPPINGQQYYFPPPPLSPAPMHLMSPPMSPQPQMIYPQQPLSPPPNHFHTRTKSAGAGLMPGYIPHARSGSPLPVPPVPQLQHIFSSVPPFTPVFSPPPQAGRRPLPPPGAILQISGVREGEAEADPGEGEEGKGLIAARVSTHLRLTSRHRSVSPRSHRFRGPQTSAIAAPVPVPAQASPSHTATAISGIPMPAPSTPPLARPISGLPGSGSGELVSPRPMLSPAQSHSDDRRHSRNVEELERIVAVDAAHQGQDGPDTSKGGIGISEAQAQVYKTLPRPPPPSNSGKPVLVGIKMSTTPKPRADEVFVNVLPLLPVHLGGDVNVDVNKLGPVSEPISPADAPPTPQLTAVTPRGPNLVLSFGLGAELHARSHLMLPGNGVADGALSGLDALERRLLAEVGTRKIAADERRTDVRNVLPVVGSVGGERARGGKDAPDTGRGMAIPIHVVPIEPLNDSAISSLTLADHLDRANERTDIAAGQDEDREQDEDEEDEDERTHHAGRSDGEELGTRHGHRRWRAEGTVRGNEDTRVGRKREREPAAPMEKHQVESHNMRQTAKSRVAAWLGGIDPADLQFDLDTGLDPTIDPEGAADLGSAVVAEEDVQAVAADLQQGATSEQLPAHKPSKDEDEDEGEQDQPSIPNPRSSGFVPIGSAKADEARRQSGFREPARKTESSTTLPKRPRLPIFPPSAQKLLDPEVKYDIRSARGGRGGRVTAVASIWASQPGKEAAIKPIPQKSVVETRSQQPIVQLNVQKPIAERRAHDSKTTAAPPKPAATITPPSTKKMPSPSRTPEPDFNARRPMVAKSTSAPATVSSSHAIPTLSSSASLARPNPRILHSKSPFKVLPSVVESLPEVAQVSTPLTSSVKVTPAGSGGDLAFGRARLRDLIKKYQGQAT